MIITKKNFKELGKNFLPFSEAVSKELPLVGLLRLSLFQVSVGIATVLLVGTLNRVMIVELGVMSSLVATMVAIPILLAPFRAFLGFRSDNHKSHIGWKRIPYIWYGAMWQFGGIAVMPMSIIVLSGDQAVGPWWAGHVLVAIAFLATGFGAHLTQTAGLALAADRASDKTRPQVVALLYVMFLVGMGLAALTFGFLLYDFSKLKLIQVVQGAAVVTLLLNIVALWKQEKLVPTLKKDFNKKQEPFLPVLNSFIKTGGGSLLLVVFFGTLALSMQDILLEPYGGEVLNLSVSATTNLTALWVLGALIGLVIASKLLKERKRGPIRSIVIALFVAIIGFCCVIMSDPMSIVLLYFIGSTLIGLGTGLFAVSTLIIAMTIPISKRAGRGLVLGSWGAAQATAAGLGIGLGGILNDITRAVVGGGDLTFATQNPAFSYLVVYHLEILLLFFTLVLLGPLSQYLSSLKIEGKSADRFGFSEMPI